MILIHIQRGAVLDEGDGVVQGPVSGQIGTDGVPDDIGQLVVGPVELGGAVDEGVVTLAVLLGQQLHWIDRRTIGEGFPGKHHTCRVVRRSPTVKIYRIHKFPPYLQFIIMPVDRNTDKRYYGTIGTVSLAVWLDQLTDKVPGRVLVFAGGGHGQYISHWIKKFPGLPSAVGYPTKAALSPHRASP